ncbi:16S rRNA (cytidine(1402)-2'-O)-methyltransferase [Candidatus Woesebacteria bacterium]|nr:16S rRNA (cytidine(1402)-2'-O)-methyltransferase [Candidatus Woesebacteria bacterium]|tara:strand:+ start:187 stop:876 length:690 start_codon:yes stop_codon:yes gene_type:complete
MSKLYIISTPIGNLEDITFRAIRTLGKADTILAEDTRSTQNLLKHYDIQNKKLISFFDGNEEKRIPEAIDLLKAGKDIVLVSESGTPLVSDPGYKLVRETIQSGIQVEAIPGPTAAIVALTVSGLPPDKFTFLGFLPKKEGKARKTLEELRPSQGTIILYESPYRVVKTLQLIKEVFGDIDIAAARELTKIHEEVRREKVSRSIDHFTKTKPKGEFVILFDFTRPLLPP